MKAERERRRRRKTPKEKHEKLKKEKQEKRENYSRATGSPGTNRINFKTGLQDIPVGKQKKIGRSLNEHSQ